MTWLALSPAFFFPITYAYCDIYATYWDAASIMIGGYWITSARMSGHSMNGLNGLRKEIDDKEYALLFLKYNSIYCSTFSLLLYYSHKKHIKSNGIVNFLCSFSMISLNFYSNIVCNHKYLQKHGKCLIDFGLNFDIWYTVGLVLGICVTNLYYYARPGGISHR